MRAVSRGAAKQEGRGLIPPLPCWGGGRPAAERRGRGHAKKGPGGTKPGPGAFQEILGGGGCFPLPTAPAREVESPRGAIIGRDPRRAHALQLRRDTWQGWEPWGAAWVNTVRVWFCRSSQWRGGWCLSRPSPPPPGRGGGETKIDEFTHAACSPGRFNVLNGEMDPRTV